jgi:hypothetical protein
LEFILKSASRNQDDKHRVFQPKGRSLFFSSLNVIAAQTSKGPIATEHPEILLVAG